MKKLLLLSALAVCAMGAQAEDYTTYFKCFNAHGGAEIANGETVVIKDIDPVFSDPEFGDSYEFNVNVKPCIDDQVVMARIDYVTPDEAGYDDVKYGDVGACFAALDADDIAGVGNCYPRGDGYIFFQPEIDLKIYGQQLQIHDRYIVGETPENQYKLTIIPVDDEEAIYTIYFSFGKGTTGVAGVELDENAPVEYFNMQGMRVANPDKGLYIVRQGSKTWKEVR